MNMSLIVGKLLFVFFLRHVYRGQVGQVYLGIAVLLLNPVSNAVSTSRHATLSNTSLGSSSTGLAAGCPGGPGGPGRTRSRRIGFILNSFSYTKHQLCTFNDKIILLSGLHGPSIDSPDFYKDIVFSGIDVFLPDFSIF